MHQESSLERQVAELLALSRDFTRIIENLESIDPEQFTSYLFRINMLLYVAGMAMPETEEPDYAGDHFVTEEQWETVFNGISNKLNKGNELLFNSGSDIETASIAEYCADIYQDLKDFELQLSKSTTAAVAYSVYEIKQLFKHHWGIRLLRMQTHLHQLLHPENDSTREYEFYD